MLTLGLDTSTRFLIIALIKDQTLIGSLQKDCNKHQSENIFPELIQLFDKANVKPLDLDEIVITKGPGSYTGVRIAMTIAKTYAALKPVTLYTISSCLLYAGLKENVRVILDARSKRIYTAKYHLGNCIEEPHISTLEEFVVHQDENLIGDLNVLGKQDVYPFYPQHFVELRPFYHLESNIHTVSPEYLKSSDEYLVKK